MEYARVSRQGVGMEREKRELSTTPHKEREEEKGGGKETIHRLSTHTHTHAGVVEGAMK